MDHPNRFSSELEDPEFREGTTILIDPFLTRNSRMNLALSGGVDPSRITMIRGGEKLDFKEFTVDVIPSEHRISRGRSSPRRVLHQSTANFIVENLEGSNPDVALLAQGYRSYDLEAALRAMRPKVIIMHHFDQWRVPFAEGIKSRNERRARHFRRGIKRVDPRIEVIIVADEAVHAVGLLLDDPEELLDLRRAIRARAAKHRRRRTLDRRQRRAQLVAYPVPAAT